MHYYSLIYASTTASTPATIRQDLIDILATARAHNFNQQICGVLYYGNDHFFQCLQGDKAKLDRLYQKLIKDPRHANISLLAYYPIAKPALSNWDMKYVRQDGQLQEFFARHQWKEFNPYLLKDEILDEFLTLLIPHVDMRPGEHETVGVNNESLQSALSASVLWTILVVFVMILALYLIYYLY